MTGTFIYSLGMAFMKSEHVSDITVVSARARACACWPDIDVGYQRGGSALWDLPY